MHMSTGRYNFQIEGLYLGIFSKGSSVILRPVPRSVEMYYFLEGLFTLQISSSLAVLDI